MIDLDKYLRSVPIKLEYVIAKPIDEIKDLIPNAKSMIILLIPMIGLSRENIVKKWIETLSLLHSILIRIALFLRSEYNVNSIYILPFYRDINVYEIASRFGLGILGRNGRLIHPEYGPRNEVGLLVCDREVSGMVNEKKLDFNPCEGCYACTAECPSGAISIGNVFEIEKCRFCLRCIISCPIGSHYDLTF